MSTFNKQALAEFFMLHRPALVRYIQRSFSGMDVGRAEDAVFASFEAAMEHPERFEAVWGSPARLLGLFRVVSWRAARGVCRRKAFSCEIVMLEDRTAGAMAEQGVVELLDQLQHLTAEASAQVSRTHASTLKAAVLAGMVTGESDTRLASRYAIRREYVNRTRRMVLRQLAA